MQPDKKIVAALAAVSQYIQAEEELLYMQAMAAPACDQRPSTAPPAALNVWGMSGRQAQMQMRSLMQARAFK